MKVTKDFEFDAAHRLMDYEGKCATLHGHRYKISVTVEVSCLDEIGMAVDFSEIKSSVGNYLKSTMDHVTVLRKDDPLCDVLKEDAERSEFIKPPLLMDVNPTAENMANIFVDVFREFMSTIVGKRFVSIEVVVFETPTSSAKVLRLA
jgi:6-pyruvoyltetrahydropterin/6-carboxytetrahydropterin synthase